MKSMLFRNLVLLITVMLSISVIVYYDSVLCQVLVV